MGKFSHLSISFSWDIQYVYPQSKGHVPLESRGTFTIYAKCRKKAEFTLNPDFQLRGKPIWEPIQESVVLVETLSGSIILSLPFPPFWPHCLFVWV